MPKAIKKRIAKKAGSKEEEVKSAAAHALDAIKSKKNVLLPGLTALVVVIVLLIVFMSYSASAKNRAYALEKEAYQYYYGLDTEPLAAEGERWKKPLELFQKSVEIRSTPSALFYIGNCYFNLGDYENAEKAYSRFIGKYKGEWVMLPLVYQKLASLYIKQGENDKALETLGELGEVKNGTFLDTALILEARLYDQLGRQEEAMARYREITESFPASPWGSEARTGMGAGENKAAAEEEGQPQASE